MAHQKIHSINIEIYRQLVRSVIQFQINSSKTIAKRQQNKKVYGERKLINYLLLLKKNTYLLASIKL